LDVGILSCSADMLIRYKLFVVRNAKIIFSISKSFESNPILNL
jgi:hypothetical protein